MTLLEDIEKAIESDVAYYFDAQGVANITGSVIEEGNIFIDTVRWGHLEGTVFARFNLKGHFDYVQVVEYCYSGDSDGDMELTASVVYPHKVTTTEWESTP